MRRSVLGYTKIVFRLYVRSECSFYRHQERIDAWKKCNLSFFSVKCKLSTVIPLAAVREDRTGGSNGSQSYKTVFLQSILPLQRQSSHSTMVARSHLNLTRVQNVRAQSWVQRCRFTGNKYSPRPPKSFRTEWT